MENAVNMFLVLLGYRAAPGRESLAPIMTPQIGRELGYERFARLSVDPLPQALVLTSIVIGVSVVALMVVMAVRLHQKYGTFDLTKIRELRG